MGGRSHGLSPAIRAGAALQLLRPSWASSRTPPGLPLKVVYSLQRRELDGVVVVSHPELGRVRVRTAIGTLLDGLNAPAKCGGLERVAAFLARVLRAHRVDEVVRAAREESDRPARLRLGFLLELDGAPAAALEPLRKGVPGKYLLLDPTKPRDGELHSGWRLRVNTSTDALEAALTI